MEQKQHKKNTRAKQIATSDEQLKKRQVVWDLRQKGWTQERIGLELGMTQQGIAVILASVHKEYKEAHLKDVERVKSEQVANLERICDEAMQAWERSKLDRKVKSVKNTPGSGGMNAMQSISQQCGDSKYLQVAIKAKEDIRKIIGADAPIKIINEEHGRNYMYAAIYQDDMPIDKAKSLYEEALLDGKIPEKNLDE